LRNSTTLTAVALLSSVAAGCCGRAPPGREYVAIPAEVPDLVAHLSTFPYSTHANMTRSTERLVEIGEPALPFVIPLMLSDDEWTRRHADTVISGTGMALFGWKAGQGWTRPGGEAGYRSFDRRLGSMRWNASQEDRERSVKLWKTWLDSRVAAGVQCQPIASENR
jgi:hypothetical protein